MGTIKQEAEAYEGKQTLNITELDVISTDIELRDDSFKIIDEKSGEEKEIKTKVIDVDGKTYRVPVSVLNSLKSILEDSPDLKKFRVKKSGEGLKTHYTVIPIL